ncbi:MAG: hypothetical protein ABEJ56_05980 [Candidatus Nanohaloarchaea archaeon]
MPASIDYTESEDHVEMSKEEFERVRATIETLEDQEVLDQLKKKSGRQGERKS